MGQFTAEIEDPVAMTAISIPAGEVMRMVGHQDDFTGGTDLPLLDLQDAVEQIFSVSLLGPLAEEVPVGIRSRDIFSGETDEESTVFEVVPSGLPILQASRYAGIPGDPLYLTGAAFAPSSTVRITIDSIEYPTVASALDGSFVVFVPIPTLPTGDYFVTALDALGNYDFSILTIAQDPLAGGQPQGIPTLTTWGLVALVTLLTLSGAALVRRRHEGRRDDDAGGAGV